MGETTDAGNNPPVDRGSTESERARHGMVARSATDVGQTHRPRRVGLSAHAERFLNVAGIIVLVLFALGWTLSIAYANSAERRGDVVPSASRTVAAAITNGSAPSAAYVTDAALNALAARVR